MTFGLAVGHELLGGCLEGYCCIPGWKSGSQTWLVTMEEARSVRVNMSFG